MLFSKSTAQMQDFCDTFLYADTLVWTFATSLAFSIDQIRDVNANMHMKPYNISNADIHSSLLTLQGQNNV
jgi:hypothetical protein